MPLQTMKLAPSSRVTPENRVNIPLTAPRNGKQLQMIDIPEDVFPSGVKGRECLPGT